jgi:hypothetical protein
MQPNRKGNSSAAAYRAGKPVPDETLDRDTKVPLRGEESRRAESQLQRDSVLHDRLKRDTTRS